METLYSILNKDAKNWWYHKQLRSMGEIKEARKRERESILSIVHTLRAALENKGYAMVGRGGWSIHDTDHSTRSGYGDINEPDIRACIMLGIPVCDSTTIHDDLIYKVVGFPMAAIHSDPLPVDGYHSLDYAPVKYVFDLYKNLGATIYNMD